MKIIVIDADGKQVERSFALKKVVVGRDESCDLKIESNLISRKHLEIEQSKDKIYVTDISSSNWVKVDGSQLEKKIKKNYNSNTKVLLPGPLRVVVEREEMFELEEEFVDEPGTAKEPTRLQRLLIRSIKLEKKVTKDDVVLNTNKNTTKKARPIKRENNLRGRQSRVDEPQPEAMSEKIKFRLPAFWPIIKKIALISIIALGIYKTFNFTDVKPSKEAIIAQKKLEKVIEKKVVKKSKAQLHFEDHIKEKKCHTKLLKALCKVILKKWNNFEGIQKEKNTIVLFALKSRRLIDFLGKDLHQLDELAGTDKINQVIVFYLLQNRSLLKGLENSKMLKIKTHLYDIEKSKIKYKATYSLNTSFYRRFTKGKVEVAFKEIKKRLIFDAFDRNLSKLLVKE